VTLFDTCEVINIKNIQELRTKSIKWPFETFSTTAGLGTGAWLSE
jgi:hypothetical protein